MNQDRRFTNFLREKAKEAERAIRYRPNHFLGMLESIGGYMTAVKLLSANEVSEGFTKLWEHDRLDLSIEALVVESEWRPAIDSILLVRAEKRLEKANYCFTRWDGEVRNANAEPPVLGSVGETNRAKRANRIVIAWPCGDEHIDIDVGTLSETSDICVTKQTYPNGSKSDIYQVSSTLSKLPDQSYEINIVYDSAKNPGIKDSWWGTTSIVVRKDETTGFAFWHDTDDESQNGRFEFKTVYSVEAEDSRLWAVEGESLARRADLSETVKKALRNERRGQWLFRERVMQCERACRLTGVSDPIHLRASHIKPWADANPYERLDGNNGLMLAPHIDHLFDRAYISFEDDGTLLVLNNEIYELLKRWGVDLDKDPPVSKPFNPQQRLYLEHHRRRFTSLQQQA